MNNVISVVLLVTQHTPADRQAKQVATITAAFGAPTVRIVGSQCEVPSLLAKDKQTYLFADSTVFETSKSLKLVRDAQEKWTLYSRDVAGRQAPLHFCKIKPARKK